MSFDVAVGIFAHVVAVPPDGLSDTADGVVLSGGYFVQIDGTVLHVAVPEYALRASPSVTASHIIAQVHADFSGIRFDGAQFLPVVEQDALRPQPMTFGLREGKLGTEVLYDNAAGGSTTVGDVVMTAVAGVAVLQQDELRTMIVLEVVVRTSGAEAGRVDGVAILDGASRRGGGLDACMDKAGHGDAFHP